jgi:hypothetical protein
MLELLTLIISCSPPPPGFYDTRPVGGAMLPANAKVVLVGYQIWNPQVTVSQLDAIYQVDALIENGIARADIGALGIKGDMTLFATSTDPGAMSVTASFFVADGIDTQAPQFGGIDSLSYEILEDIPGFCSAGGFHVRAHLTPASDDWQTTHYQLYEVLPNDELVWVGSTYHTDSPELSLFAYAGTEEGTRCYVAFATDVAGNTSPDDGRGRCVDLRYEQPDGGVIDSGLDDGGGDGDASPRDSGANDTGTRDSGGGGGLTLEEGEGCGCSVMRTEQPSLLFVLLLLTVGRLRPFYRRRADPVSNQLEIEDGDARTRDHGSRPER